MDPLAIFMITVAGIGTVFAVISTAAVMMAGNKK